MYFKAHIWFDIKKVPSIVRFKIMFVFYCPNNREILWDHINMADSWVLVMNLISIQFKQVCEVVSADNDIHLSKHGHTY
jgi:hypothetical protein